MPQEPGFVLIKSMFRDRSAIFVEKPKVSTFSKNFVSPRKNHDYATVRDSESSPDRLRFFFDYQPRLFRAHFRLID